MTHNDNLEARATMWRDCTCRYDHANRRWITHCPVHEPRPDEAQFLGEDSIQQIFAACRQRWLGCQPLTDKYLATLIRKYADSDRLIDELIAEILQQRNAIECSKGIIDGLHDDVASARQRADMLLKQGREEHDIVCEQREEHRRLVTKLATIEETNCHLSNENQALRQSAEHWAKVASRRVEPSGAVARQRYIIESHEKEIDSLKEQLADERIRADGWYNGALDWKRSYERACERLLQHQQELRKDAVENDRLTRLFQSCHIHEWIPTRVGSSGGIIHTEAKCLRCPQRVWLWDTLDATIMRWNTDYFYATHPWIAPDLHTCETPQTHENWMYRWQEEV